MPELLRKSSVILRKNYLECEMIQFYYLQYFKYPRMKDIRDETNPKIIKFFASQTK